jgi:hypothetical protein
MPQELIFNELCVRYEEIRLKRPLEDATRWLVQFSQLLSLLSRHKNIKELRVPIKFKDAYLVDGYNLGRLLGEGENLIEKDHRTNIKQVTDRGKYLEDVDEIIDDDGIFEHRADTYMFCHVGLGEYCRGFGAAHLFNAMSISIDVEEDHWNCDSVIVEKHHNSGNSTVAVSHACKNIHLHLAERIFDPNPKHNVIVERGQITKMDLENEEAQAILDRAAQPDGEERFYGYSDRTGRFYVFPQHVKGFYHGYPVELSEIRNRKQVLRQLNDLGVIDDTMVKRLLKG